MGKRLSSANNLKSMIIIKQKKSKAILLTIGSIVLVVICFTLINHESSNFYRTIEGRVGGYIGITLFSLVAMYGISKLFILPSGIEIDSLGFKDYSSYTGFDFVSWADVDSISTTEIKQQKIILVHLKNPETYLKHSVGLKKYLRWMNYKLTGTPVTISHTSLDTSHEELKRVIMLNFVKYLG